MTRAHLILAAVACLPLTACTYVATTQPVGAPIAEKLAAKIEGRWIAADGVIYVKSLDGGRVRLAGINEDKDEFKLNQRIVVLTQMDDAIYTHFPMPDQGAPEKYSLGRLTVVGDGESMILYGPRYNVWTGPKVLPHPTRELIVI